MARLILVRHGETEWNRTMRYQGQTDTELNETGIRQAERAADRLAGESIDSVYSSDLKRARSTAEIIAARHGMDGAIRDSSLLREMHFGDFEGLTFEEIEERYQLIFSASPSWRSRGPHVRAPNGESIADMAARVERFMHGFPTTDPKHTALIVAHGGPLQVLLCQLLGVGLEHWWQFRLSSASVSIVETYPQGASMVSLNDVSHLEEL